MAGSSLGATVANPLKLTRDGRGRWRRQNLGVKRTADGELAKATFTFGKDHNEACRRVVLLEQMWEAVVRTWDEVGGKPPPVWEGGTYSIALAVARGEAEISVPVPPCAPGDTGMQATYLADLRAQFPFLSLRF